MNSPLRSARLFVGVAVRSSPGIASLLREVAALGPSVRAVAEDRLHVTLKFLGEVVEDGIAPLAARLSEASPAAEAFDWKLVGTGTFPSPARPSVVWAGTDESDRFASLAEEVEKACGRLGYSRELRPYRAHVTLARVRFRPPPSLLQWLERTAGTTWAGQRADEIALYRSEMRRGGSVYTPLHTWKLG